MASSSGKSEENGLGTTITTANAVYEPIGLTALRLKEWINKSSLSITVPATVKGLPVTEIGE